MNPAAFPSPVSPVAVRPPAPETTLTTPVPPFPSSLAGVAYTTALETVELDAVKAGSINPDEQVNYAVEASACSGYLHVELWDTGRGGADEADAMADPMLMVRREKTPRASYERDNNDWRFSEDTYVDLEGYRLIRAYHRVVVDMRSCADAMRARVRRLLRAQLPGAVQDGLRRARSRRQQAVHRRHQERARVGPADAGVRSARHLRAVRLGQRRPAVSPPARRRRRRVRRRRPGRVRRARRLAGGEVDRLALASGACACLEGWGDVGCDEPLVELVANAESPVAATVQPGEWAYFYVDVAAPGSAASGREPGGGASGGDAARRRRPRAVREARGRL